MTKPPFPLGKDDKSIIMHMYYTQLNSVFGNQTVVNKRKFPYTHDVEWSKADLECPKAIEHETFVSNDAQNLGDRQFHMDMLV
ncbi:hypothetical protein TURU_050096 [Turdus rufiventris]|nr:hypothetical protein TURU_050096 [Turdus rufiventris]